MLPYLKLLRTHHWIKNAFIFIPAFFSRDLFDRDNFLTLILAFFAFSFIASSIYIINDYKDIESDKNHPKKKSRPLASGEAKPSIAIGFMIVFLISGFSIALYINNFFVVLLAFYFVMNLAYSMGFKNISILDVIILSFGFLLRAYGGGIAIEIPISQWLIIMVFLLALFMAIAKRRDDVVMFIQSGKQTRKSAGAYNLEFINATMSMICGIVIVAYLMYTISPEVTTRMHSNHIYLTTIFVIAGMLRYLQITFVEQNSGSPTKILYSDKFIIFTIIAWLLSFYVVIYFPTYIK